MLCRILIFVTLCAGSPVFGDEAASNPRIERIERLLGEIRTELDSLKKEGTPPGLSTQPPRVSPPVYQDLLTERQRRLAAGTRTEHRTTAAGYSFNSNSPFMMSAIHWWDPSWGARFEGTVSWRDGDIYEQEHYSGVNVSLLRSIHRFEGFESLETHLYGFAGTGLFRERFGYRDHTGGTGRFVWYEKPDLSWHLQVGAGTELNIFALGGVLLVPEIGMQAKRYLVRFQDSDSWRFRYPTGVTPESNFSLDAYFAFHLNFYFR